MKKNALAAVYVLLPATKMQLLWKTEKHIFCVMIFVMVLGIVFQPVLQEQLLLKNAKVRNIIRLLLK